MMLALLDSEQSHGGEAGQLRKLGIRQIASAFTEELGQLNIKGAFSHPETVAKQSYRMCYVLN